MDSYAICPFLMYRIKGMIACESGHLNFESSKEALKFMHENCNTWNYEQCPHAKALFRKYESA